MHHDVIIVGAGHNGLVCAVLLARAGLRVVVLEEKPVLGGAARTEYPFKKAPGLGISTGAYLLGLMPPELMKLLGLELPLRRRDPHYFLPTSGDRYLLLGSDAAEARRQYVSFFSEADYVAQERMNAELAQLREDLAPAWLSQPVSLEETAARYIRPELTQVFLDLARGSAVAYLDRFGFKSDLVKAMYAVTDGFTGVTGGWDSPGTGLNFLGHNMCRLPGAHGTWMLVEGGMGTVTARLADLARRAGAVLETSSGVARVDVEGGVARGVTLLDGRVLRAPVVVSNADPFRSTALAGGALGDGWKRKIDGLRRPGSSLKVNLCLRDLPRFTCLGGAPLPGGPTIHLLPEDSDVAGALRRAHTTAAAGRLAETPTIEWYIHSSVEPSLRDEAGRHNSALFVTWVPYAIEGSTWEAEESRYVARLLEICDHFAPGTSSLVEETFALTPPKIESHFGITGGHIQHVDNSIGFGDRADYRTPVGGYYLCGAGCHPAGAVSGAAGHNAAKLVLRDLGRS